MLSKIVKFLFLFILIFGFLSFKTSVLAQENQDNNFVNLVNPVRGTDFWGLKEQEPLDAVGQQWQLISDNNLPATWLLRSDALSDGEITNFFKDLPENQEIGIFLEVTPSWAKKAQINYHQQALWHYADSVLLSGYKIIEREKLIDQAFTEFKQIFGSYPTSVGAWHIDAGSLAYMQKNYGIESALICADQFLTDDYQLWGGWWGVPYYPSSYNVLTPAQSQKNKLDLVIFQWAARDPLKAYGGGIQESTYSIQANDYLKHNLDVNYFSSLVDVYLYPLKAEFGQITVGLENDNPWSFVGQEYQKEIEVLVNKNPRFVSMSDFAGWYKKQFPKLSPDHQIGSLDLTDNSNQNQAVWLMSINGRLGLLKENDQVLIRDWRLYNEKFAEPFLRVANQEHQLRLNLPAQIDTVRFPEQLKSIDGQPEDYLIVPGKLPFNTSIWIFILTAVIFLIMIFWTAKINIWLLPILIFGVLTQVVTMFKSGLLYSYGMGFWGPNGHDGVWHLALIRELTRNWLPTNMVFAGLPLSNYHWLFDGLLATIHRLTALPIVNLYFQIFPVVISCLLGLLSYLVAKKITKNNLSGILAAFFVYFGGSFGYLLTLFKGQGLGGESTFWANQPISFLINPPFAISVVIMLLGFYLFYDYQQKPSGKRLVILSLIFGLLIGFKAYAGVVVLAGLGLSAFYHFLTKKKWSIVWLFLGSLVVSLIVFLPTNKVASSLFVFSPLWFVHTMLAFTDRLDWNRLDQARQAYLASGLWPKLILAEGLALTIFFVGNLGTRIIGLVQVFKWFKNPKKINPFVVFLIGCILTSTIIPLLFIQKGNPWNTIQFFYYFLFLTGLLAAFWLGQFLQKKKTWFKVTILFLLAIFTLPTTIGTLKHYLPNRAPARIGFEELQALDFLQEQKPGIVLTYPHDYQLRGETEAPKPLFAYETSAYVSALGGKIAFLEDEMNLEIMQVDWRLRRKEVEQFFNTDDIGWAKEFLGKNKIVYLYLVNNQSLVINPDNLDLNKVFDNGLVKIYQSRVKI